MQRTCTNRLPSFLFLFFRCTSTHFTSRSRDLSYPVFDVTDGTCACFLISFSTSYRLQLACRFSQDLHTPSPSSHDGVPPAQSLSISPPPPLPLQLKWLVSGATDCELLDLLCCTVFSSPLNALNLRLVAVCLAFCLQCFVSTLFHTSFDVEYIASKTYSCLVSGRRASPDSPGKAVNLLC